MIYKKNLLFIFAFAAFIFVFFSSCKNRDLNYITYYNKVNDIDSVLRFQRDTLTTIKRYRKLFRKYPPKNQVKIQELETFIKLADQLHKNFGGKKKLYKLIPLVAPYWKFKREEGDFFQLYKKYGIDSLKIEKEVLNWKKNLDRQLVDSFTIAFVRDQAENRQDIVLMKKNDRKNAELLKWSFENKGYPSMQKIGLFGNDDVFMPMLSMFVHMSFVEQYPYLKNKIFSYILSGECPPRDYAGMVDRYNLQVTNEDILYGTYISYDTQLDTLKINRNRKSIGLPSIEHSALISRDFLRKN